MIYTLVNQKGGVGKTTSAVNIASGLARLKKRVLVVDLDPQGSATLSLGLRADKSVYEVLRGDMSVKNAIVTYNNYDVIPANVRLAKLDAETNGEPGREMLLTEALEPIKGDYDFIFIDCPPSLGLLTLCGLSAADALIIPVQPEILALHGLKQIGETVTAVKKRINPRLHLGGVLVTMYDGRKVLNRNVFDTLKKQYPETFLTPIRNNIAIAEAPGSKKDVFEYAPKSNGAADYMEVSKEIIERSLKK